MLDNYQARQTNEHGTILWVHYQRLTGAERSPLRPGNRVRWWRLLPLLPRGQSYLGYDPLNNTSGIFMTPSI